MAKRIHTMVRVLDLERSLRFCRDAFGLAEVHRLDFPPFALAYRRNRENDVEVELTANKGRKEIHVHGDGYKIEVLERHGHYR
jgi:lactoylglutathione lyase